MSPLIVCCMYLPVFDVPLLVLARTVYTHTRKISGVSESVGWLGRPASGKQRQGWTEIYFVVLLPTPFLTCYTWAWWWPPVPRTRQSLSAFDSAGMCLWGRGWRNLGAMAVQGCWIKASQPFQSWWCSLQSPRITSVGMPAASGLFTKVITPPPPY